MKRWILVLLLLVARHGTALSDVPLLINYQGQLTGTSGAEVELTFRLFPTDSGGESLWEETHTVATSGSGFSVLLGSLLPLPDAVFESENLYLSLSTEDEELVPRQRIVSVIFSKKAGVAENVTPSTITPSAIQLIDGQGLWNSEGLETGTLKVDSLVVGETPVINSSATWVGPSQPAQSTRLYTIIVLDFEGDVVFFDQDFESVGFDQFIDVEGPVTLEFDCAFNWPRIFLSRFEWPTSKSHRTISISGPSARLRQGYPHQPVTESAPRSKPTEFSGTSRLGTTGSGLRVTVIRM